MLEFLNDNIISLITPILLIISGLYFSFKLKFFYIRHPVKIIRSMLTLQKKGGISPFRAVTLALAGTLGVGNIAGVASSIAIGGFGSVFWMWISALVAMVLKYAEITLAISHRRTDFSTGEHHGGASYYIYDHFAANGKKRFGKALAICFALLCIINAITMGCVIQSNAVSTSFEGVMNIKPWIIGAVVALLSVIVISGNAKWISSFSEKTVPIMTVGYILLSVAVLAARRELIGDAFAAIFKDAFSIRSAAGGAVGFGISRALKAGTMRGLMSNEAGCGTAPTAHAAADTDSPAKQGFWGIFEVFVDTILLCTLTALVIIVSVLGNSAQNILSYSENPMMMTIKAYSSVLGGWSEYFMAISVLLFAFATMICWAHYGKESILYITKNRAFTTAYILTYCLFIFIGALTAPKLAWLAADLALGIMTIINLAVLFLMSDEVRCETDKFFNQNGRKP
ncbi:MAG: sodium:alanine symporter family protein [Clostridia bacterium]|nr:sodium:alanine symporter family protein [Clostridia bacterium]